MIYRDRTYRTTEETSTSNPTLEGRLAALENFGGSKSVTSEIREQLNVKPAEAPAPEVKEPKAEANLNATLEPSAPAEPVAPETTATPEATTPPAEPAPSGEATKEEVTTTPLEIKSEIFEGGALNVGSTKKEEEVTYSDDINKFVEGLGYESPTEFSSVLSKYKEQETTITDLETKIQNNDALFSQMPKELYNTVVAWANKEDNWRDHVNNDGFDFMKDFDSLDKKNVVDKFYPNEFSSDDWEEYNDADGDPNVKKAIDIALKNSSAQFESKKNEIINYQDSIVKSNAKTMEAVNYSIGQTLGNLPSQMEGLSEAYVKSIESKIRNNEILGLFYNEDGSLKPDAAHRLVLAQDGASLLSQYSELYKVQASNEATQEILDRSSDAPNKTQGGSSSASTEQRSPVQQGIEALESRFNKKPIF